MNFFRPFDLDISEADVAQLTGLMHPHKDDKTLEYHGYFSPKKTFRTQFAQDMRSLGEKLDVKLAGIYAFSARAGSVTPKHIDGEQNNTLIWRLCFYVGGEPGILSWYRKDPTYSFDPHVGAYIGGENDAPLYSRLLDVKAGFVRTEYPHVLDLSNTTTDRITITATFAPQISWEELNVRLDNL
jgi:hypothetical protein